MSRMNVPQLWQKWLMMSAHTGGLLRSSRQGMSPTDDCAPPVIQLQSQRADETQLGRPETEQQN